MDDATSFLQKLFLWVNDTISMSSINKCKDLCAEKKKNNATVAVKRNNYCWHCNPHSTFCRTFWMDIYMTSLECHATPMLCIKCCREQCIRSMHCLIVRDCRNSFVHNVEKPKYSPKNYYPEECPIGDAIKIWSPNNDLAYTRSVWKSSRTLFFIRRFQILDDENYG